MTALLLLIGASTLGLIALSHSTSRRGAPARYPGGQLAPCPEGRNCVCSEGSRQSSTVEPLRFSGRPEAAQQALLRAISVTGGVVRSRDEGYIWATYRSAIFRFTDDVEFRIDPQHGLVHLRSASRAGHSDFGVNRRRVERIRAQFDEQQLSP